MLSTYNITFEFVSTVDERALARSDSSLKLARVHELGAVRCNAAVFAMSLRQTVAPRARVRASLGRGVPPGRRARARPRGRRSRARPAAGGRRVHEHPGRIKLQAGDVLLLEAGPTFLRQSIEKEP